MQNKHMVQVRNVSKTYKQGDVTNEVLKRVSFNIEKGKMVAIIGNSGSGKTTLLNLLGALDHMEYGKISIDEQLVSAMNEREKAAFRKRNIGFIFQDFNLIQVLNVYENILLPLELNKLAINESLIDDMLKRLDIYDKKFSYPSQLSGGEQQRVAIIRALVHEPKLVLADEPTGNLDHERSHNVIDVLKSLCKDYDQTVVIVTHDLQVAHRCDAVIKIENGSVIGGLGEE